MFCMHPAGREVCRSVVFAMFGPSTFYFDELFHTIINHIPAGASYRQFIHYAQISAASKWQFYFIVRLSQLNHDKFFYNFIDFCAERFQHYHYGSAAMNMKMYGTPEPPPYDLSNVRANIHIMHGTNDWLTPSIVSWPWLLFEDQKLNNVHFIQSILF